MYCGSAPKPGGGSATDATDEELLAAAAPVWLARPMSSKSNKGMRIGSPSTVEAVLTTGTKGVSATNRRPRPPRPWRCFRSPKRLPLNGPLEGGN